MTLSRHLTSRPVMRICMEAKSTVKNMLQFKLHALQWSLVAVITRSAIFMFTLYYVPVNKILLETSTQLGKKVLKGVES